MRTNNDRPWNVQPLGHLPPKEKALFYEGLSEEDTEDHFFSSNKNSMLYENPGLKVGILNIDGTIIPAELYQEGEVLKNINLDIFLERYYVHAMPGKLFDLQFTISSRHLFKNRNNADRVSHTLVAQGVLDDYINYFTEPVFQNLKVSDKLTLDLAVTFLTDRSTERLIKCLKDENLQKGIQLANIFNPVFETVATFVKGIVESLASAKKNQAITNAHLTLLSSPNQLSIPLVEGTYFLFQPSAEKEDQFFHDLYYDSISQKVRTNNIYLDRNYMILSIKKH